MILHCRVKVYGAINDYRVVVDMEKGTKAMRLKRILDGEPAMGVDPGHKLVVSSMRLAMEYMNDVMDDMVKPEANVFGCLRTILVEGMLYLEKLHGLERDDERTW